MQSFDSKDNLERQAGITRGSFKLHFPRIPGPSIPQESPLLPPRGHVPSVRTFQQPYSQHNILSRPPSLASSSRSTSPSGSMFDSADPTDEEVRHINSTARLWAGVQAEARSHSLSPYATSGTLLPILVKNCSSAANLGELSVKDPKKCFGVDTEGFLAKPYGADDHRRHSIEICSSVDDGMFGQELSEKRHVPMRGQSLHIPRKKKISPPCISIEPLFETEAPVSLASMKKLSESSMLLRRRTPSYDLALQRDSMDMPENQLSTQPLIKVERHPSHCAEYLSLPHPVPMGSLAGILCESTQPPPFDSRFEESTDFSSVNRTAQWGTSALAKFYRSHSRVRQLVERGMLTSFCSQSFLCFFFKCNFIMKASQEWQPILVGTAFDLEGCWTWDMQFQVSKWNSGSYFSPSAQSHWFEFRMCSVMYHLYHICQSFLSLSWALLMFSVKTEYTD